MIAHAEAIFHAAVFGSVSAGGLVASESSDLAGRLYGLIVRAKYEQPWFMGWHGLGRTPEQSYSPDV